MHTQSYEAALLGLTNVEPDPSAMENIWLSSSPNHQFNPAEKTPATAWEAEIDKLMKVQASAANVAERKRAVDRVQEIVAEQVPFIYLVHPNPLVAVSSQLDGVVLTSLQPDVVSNIDAIRWKGSALMQSSDAAPLLSVRSARRVRQAVRAGRGGVHAGARRAHGAGGHQRRRQEHAGGGAAGAAAVAGWMG